MKKQLLICALLFAPAAVAAGDAEAGGAKAAVCIACHGESGGKPIADYPIIGGQAEKYLIFALNAYKNGSRVNPLMTAQMATLNEQDIADLAAYFAAQQSALTH